MIGFGYSKFGVHNSFLVHMKLLWVRILTEILKKLVSKFYLTIHHFHAKIETATVNICGKT